MRRLGLPALLIPLFAALLAGATNGPLRVDPENPHWVVDASGKAVYLTGSHTWANFQERGVEGKTPDFDYRQYLAMLREHRHTFIRLWSWEHPQWMQFASADVPVRYKPMAFERTGPGIAHDGRPKFDLSRFNAAYFRRLRQRVQQARDAGFYVGVMLFQGFSTEQKRGPGLPLNPKMGNQWMSHAFQRDNNINGIDGDTNGDNEGREVHQLGNPHVLEIQERYVRHVIDTLNDLDNIVWEICNEGHPKSVAWQDHMVLFIHQYEGRKPVQHLVWFSAPYPHIANSQLIASGAELISPSGKQFLDDPPVVPNKVVLVDDDHIAPWACDFRAPWKAFLRGQNFLHMDGYRDFRIKQPDVPRVNDEAIRIAMGQVAAWAKRVNLARLRPDIEAVSTRYCLSDPGREYLVYQPTPGERFSVTLPPGRYRAVWYDATIGVDGPSTTFSQAHGGKRRFTPPLSGRALLWLRRRTVATAGSGR